MSEPTINVKLTSYQLSIITDLVEERIEDVDADIAHFTENPAELADLTEPGQENLTLEDYQKYREDVLDLLDGLPGFDD